VEEDPRTGNNKLTKAWLLRHDVTIAKEGTRKEVQLMARRNGVQETLVAQLQTKCVVCERTTKPFVVCSTPEGDGCGTRYCQWCHARCVAGDVIGQDHVRPVPWMKFTSNWKKKDDRYLHCQACADDASRDELMVPETGGWLTDAELDEVSAPQAEWIPDEEWATTPDGDWGDLDEEYRAVEETLHQHWYEHQVHLDHMDVDMAVGNEDDVDEIVIAFDFRPEVDLCQ